MNYLKNDILRLSLVNLTHFDTAPGTVVSRMGQINLEILIVIVFYSLPSVVAYVNLEISATVYHPYYICTAMYPAPKHEYSQYNEL